MAHLSILLRICFLSAIELFFEISTFYTHTLNMFTFVQSTAAKLAAKLATRTSRSVVTPVTIERSYDPKFYGDLVKRLRIIESRDHTLLDDVRSVGRRVFGQLHSICFSTCPAESNLLSFLRKCEEAADQAYPDPLSC